MRVVRKERPEEALVSGSGKVMICNACAVRTVVIPGERSPAKRCWLARYCMGYKLERFPCPAECTGSGTQQPESHVTEGLNQYAVSLGPRYPFHSALRCRSPSNTRPSITTTSLALKVEDLSV